MTGLSFPKAMLFDWDDTLVDTWGVVWTAVNATLVAMGRAPWSEDEARRTLGPPARVLFTQLFGESLWQEADAIYIAAYKDNIAGHLRAHDGAEDVLRSLKARDIYMAVVSAKRGPLLRQESRHLGFDGYFSALVGAGDAARDKPDIAAASMALEGSGIGAGPDVWFLGDSLTDLASAANAKCVPVLIETKLPPEEAIARNPPLLRFKTHADLLAWIKAN